MHWRDILSSKRKPPTGFSTGESRATKRRP